MQHRRQRMLEGGAASPPSTDLVLLEDVVLEDLDEFVDVPGEDAHVDVDELVDVLVDSFTSSSFSWTEGFAVAGRL